MTRVRHWLRSHASELPGLALAAVLAAVVGALVVPLPPLLVDLGLALNLAASLALLVAALYARDPLAVASFPTLLLLTTLLRLGLNVSSTRLALSEGHAGEVIAAFGEFVVRGNYVVGAVVFAILALVQLLVVAKGAERVAEVSARFTLDAMPGKQMSIDADLRAGAIDQSQARARRRVLERESQLYGAMDGAMKFVKGDVLAGLIIVLVNLLGGTAVGVLQAGQGLREALETYALLAIGDGLASQLPSMCVAVAAGLLVTRVASDREGADLGADIGAQLLGEWRALWVVGGLCLALGALPGMPHLVFGALGAASIAGGEALRRRRARGKAAAPAAPERADGAAPPARAREDLALAPVSVDLAPDLAWMVADGGTLLGEELPQLRARLAQRLGFPVPGVHLRTGAALPAGTYELRVDEVPVARGTSEPGAYAVAAPDDLGFLAAPPPLARHPVSGRSLSRVPEAAREQLLGLGVELTSGARLLCEHLEDELARRAWTLFGVQDASALLDAYEGAAPALVKELRAKIPLPLFADVLRHLLREQVSIRNLRAILEALVAPAAEGDVHALTERCRQGLARQLSHQHAREGTLFAFLVDPAVEEALRQGGPALAVDPALAARILAGVTRLAARGSAVLLASPDVRRLLRRLLEGAFPHVSVLTWGELVADLQVRPLGKLSAAGASGD